MKERLFRFKHFRVSHSQSSMPVGVDAVLVGAWSDVDGKRILDVGTGCGVIALMLAQRNPEAVITGIDIHNASVVEADYNFQQSEWKDRLSALCKSFSEIVEEGERWDCIVSNPPYFDSGVKVTEDARVRARHVGDLSPMVLISCSRELLNKCGRLTMIFPYEMADNIESFAYGNGMYVSRRCDVADHPGAKIKRTLMELKITDGKNGTVEYKGTGNAVAEKLIMFDERNEPTQEYRSLCKDFYLKF